MKSKMMKSLMNGKLNKNELFISSTELQQSIDYEVAENMALQETFNSSQFKNPFKDRIELMKKHEINNVIAGLNKKSFNKQQETYELQMMLATQPTNDDLTQYVEQFNDKKKKLNKTNEKIRQEIKDKKDNIERINYHREAVNKLAKDTVDLEIENERLANERTAFHITMDQDDKKIINQKVGKKKCYIKD